MTVDEESLAYLSRCSRVDSVRVDGDVTLGRRDLPRAASITALAPGSSFPSNLVVSPDAWPRLRSLTSLSSTVRQQLLENIATLPSLTELDLWERDAAVQPDTHTVLETGIGPRLRSLNICFSATYRASSTLESASGVEFCTALDSLSLRWVRDTMPYDSLPDDHPVTVDVRWLAPTLTSLDLDSAVLGHVWELGDRLPILRKLCLDSCGTRDHHLQCLPPSVTHLDVDVRLLTVGGLAQLERFVPRLTQLTLSPAACASWCGWADHTPRMTDADVHWMPLCTRDADRAVRALLPLAPRLTHLEAWFGSYLSDAGARLLLQSFLRLESLGLHGARPTARGLFSALRARVSWSAPTRNLRCLDLAACHGLRDWSLQPLGEACPALRVLQLQLCGRLTDECLLHLGRCRLLEELDLSGNDGIVGSGMRHLSGCTRLAELRLERCRGLLTRYLPSLVKAAPNLQRLDVSECRSLAPAHALRHLAQLRGLRDLRAVCDEPHHEEWRTGVGAALGDLCSGPVANELRGLDVTGFLDLGDSSFRHRLFVAMPRLREVSIAVACDSGGWTSTRVDRLSVLARTSPRFGFRDGTNG